MLRKGLVCLSALALVLGVFAFSACTREPGEKAENSILDQVISAKEVRVGFLPDYPPWGSRDPAGEYEGHDLDIAALLGGALGAEVELIPMEAPNRVPSVATGKVDVIIGCLTPTNGRAKAIDFTIPLGQSFTAPELISFGVRKGDQKWLNYLDNFLTNLRYSGENAELNKKSFGVAPASMVMP